MAITSSHNSVLLPIVWSAIHCRRQIRNHRKLCSRFITKQRKKNNKEKQKKGQKKKQKEKVYLKRRKIQCLLQTSPLAFASSINPTVLSFFLFFFNSQNLKIILLVLILYDSLHSFLQWVCERNESMYY